MSGEDPKAPAGGKVSPEATAPTRAAGNPAVATSARDASGAEPSPARAASGPADAADAATPRGKLPSGLFQRIRQARRALTVIRGYAFVGAMMAVALFTSSFIVYERELPRWICRLGAMGVLLGAVVGLNVMDRLVRGKPLPAATVAVALALIAVALLGVGVGSLRYDLGAAWSPLTAATYVVVGVRIMLRLRSPAPAPRT